ncbi:MAG TPA: translation elongation factor-like protein [Anaerolineae bacterium]|nr:translation elongation factor-like protein [Anaerolineae bacterium]
MAEKEIGTIINYFSRIGVAVIQLTAPLEIGDEIHIKGGDRDFQQKVESMQIEHQPIEKAEAGQEVALKLDQKARPHDSVYKM